MPVGDDMNTILREAMRLQQAGAKLPQGLTWLQYAEQSLSKGNLLSRIGQLAGKATSLPVDLIRTIKTTAILTLIGIEGENVIQRLIEEKRLDLNPIPPWLEPLIGAAVRGGSEAVGAPFFDLLIKEPLGLDLSAIPGDEGAEAVRALQRLFGFGVLLDFGTSEIHDLLKSTMGDNAPTGLLDAVKNIPQSVGVNWAVGFLLSQFVWTAYMPPLVERANNQTRPLRLQAQEAIALWQREQMSDGELRLQLANLGYRDADMDRMKSLAQQRLSLSDLQQAFLFELRDESYVRTYLKRSGVGDDEINLLVELYLTRAETAGGDQLRAVAQRGYLDNRLTRADYYNILTSVNVPPASIRLELEAADLAKTWQVKALSVGQIQTLYQKNLINDAQALQRLVTQGYSEEDAQQLIASWKATAVAAHPGLTESMVLAYLVSGVLTPSQAYDRLIGMGIKAEDASFLVQHPSAVGATKSHGPSSSLIISAYIDGVIDVTEAESRLREAGMTDDAVQLAIREASFQVVRGKQAKEPHKNLSDAQILDAFRFGLATSAWTTRQLGLAGYSDADALLIVAIEETKLAADQLPPEGWTLLQ